MYSHKEKLHAVKQYIQYDHSYASVKRELGYPKSHSSLKSWYLEYQRSGELKQERVSYFKYTEEQRKEAINHYYELCGGLEKPALTSSSVGI